MKPFTQWNWIELAIAASGAALFIAFRFLPGAWCEPTSVRVLAGAFVVFSSLLYIALVDDESKPKAKGAHRAAMGGAAGVVVAAIAAGGPELYLLLALLGMIVGYIGIFWLKHMQF